MKTIQNIFLYILLVAMAACSVEPDMTDGTDDRGNTADQPIQFHIGFAGLTKVSTDARFKSRFEEGDQIGIFMTISGTTLLSSGNYADNVKLTYTSGQWIQEGEAVYYPVEASSLDFYAYYPYTENIDPLNFTFEVGENQAEDAVYGNSDLLYAKATDLRNRAVPLQFSHLLSLIQVEVVRDGDLVAFDETFRVILLSQYSSAVVNLSTATAQPATATAVGISMNRVEDADNTRTYTYRALIPAYTIPEQGILFTFTQTTPSKEMNFTYTVEENSQLIPNKVSKWQITLEGDPIPPHYYELGDLYPHDGEPEGVVFEISNGGLNGKVMYLWDNVGTWGDSATEEATSGVPSIKNETNGKEATRDLIQMRRAQGNFGDGKDYTLFYWLYTEVNDSDINGKWYFPAKEELKSLYAFMNGVDYETVKNVWVDNAAMPGAEESKRIAFRNRIQELGGNEINMWGQYWASTEISQGVAYSIHFSEAILQTAKPKSDEKGRVLPICEF